MKVPSPLFGFVPLFPMPNAVFLKTNTSAFDAKAPILSIPSSGAESRSVFFRESFSLDREWCITYGFP
ncbi:hypothetical protein MLD38_031983 [Melastoma candidum]|uniref:Uncharacterized protein n=1 Tax=Melastoma candidum TaxID=119954 RepID=A0ACB9MSH9_9MYRT|nr:hypothetical protein MLD38_031983 [Melastoma candidum]